MNKSAKSILTAALLGLFVTVTGALAEDTDIYAANTDALSNPNILVLIDNSSNWARNDQGWPVGKQGEAELRALRLAAQGLTATTNLGLMMFNSGDVDGAYVRFHVRQMATTNRTAFMNLIGTPTCVDGSNSVNGTPNCILKNFSSGTRNESINAASTDYSAAMFEVFKYFGGYTSPLRAFDDAAGSPVDASHFGALRYASLEPRIDHAAYSADPTWLNYNSPLSAVNSCAKNYVVVIGNGYPTNDSPASLLTGVGGDASQMPAPDFVTITGDVQTLLGSGAAYASEAECVAAALATYGDAYTSYSCTSGGTGNTTDVLGNSSCGQFASATDCVTAAAAAYPGYNTYSCTVGSSCSGTRSLGTSACGKYASAAACESALPSLYPGSTSFSCALSASTCTAGTVTLNGGTGDFAAGKYATAAQCQAAAAVKYPGYSSYTCTGTGVSTDLGTTSCYATPAACSAATAALFPGYSAVTCGTPVLCSSLVHQCGSANDYNTATKCNAAAPGLLTGFVPITPTYTCFNTNDSCSPPSGGKMWDITGTNNYYRYTATGTGTAWTVTGTNAAGDRYDMTAAGGDAYTITGTKAQSLWNTFGNVNITSVYPLGTFSTSSANYADEWARFLQQTDVNAAPGQQTVTTYTIDVFKDHQDLDQTRLLMNMARAGGGKYFTATDENSIKMALQQIFSEIQSVNSVFASSSLPVSVNTQGTYLNQVFMGMFRPKGNATPRWAGNLKQYKFGLSGGQLKLVDKFGDEAISATTGFLTPCADSFWSTDTGRYWNYTGSSARGNCRAQTSNGPTPGSISFFSDAPDGDVVEKGGVAHRLRGVTLSGGVPVTSTNYLTRNLLTCDGTSTTSCISFTQFDGTNSALTGASGTTAFGIGANTAYYQSTFLDWVRGMDADDERVNTLLAEVRPSVHGGVVHSQPAVVDYGGATGVVAFYGSDDNVLHAINGGQADTDGNELWGFIAPEHYSRFRRLRSNSPLINFPGITSAAARPKDYGFDGGIGVYQQGTTVWIFPAMRRGGRSIYAFDVSTPSSPAIKWRKGCFTSTTTDDSSCAPDSLNRWTTIGQTWSKPTVSYINGYSKPVLIFGGGYDTCEDADSQSRCTTTPRKGANIWFVDADSGDVIRTYPTNYSVPGDLTILTDTVGNTTYVYATDSGGYVYRINVGTYNGTAPGGAWSTNNAPTDIVIASLGETGQTRKFLFGPAVVKYTGFNAVLVGSGDREHPLIDDYSCNSGTGGVTNRFYMLLDRPDGYPSTPIDNAGLVDVTASSTTTFDTSTGVFTNSSGQTSTQGWRFDFGACEQSVNKALVIAGTVYFGTNAPATSASACETNLGIARGYAVDFLTGNPVDAAAPRSIVYTGGGMPPSPVGGVVDLGGGTKKAFCIGCVTTTSGDCKDQLGGCETAIHVKGKRNRSYWYMEND